MSRQTRLTTELQKKLHHEFSPENDSEINAKKRTIDQASIRERPLGVQLNQQSYNYFDANEHTAAGSPKLRDSRSYISGGLSNNQKSYNKSVSKHYSQDGNSKKYSGQTPKSEKQPISIKDSKGSRQQSNNDINNFIPSKINDPEMLNKQSDSNFQSQEDYQMNHFNIKLGGNNVGSQRKIPRGPIQALNKQRQNLPALGAGPPNVTSQRQNMRGIVKNLYMNNPGGKRLSNDPSQKDVGKLNNWYNKRQSPIKGTGSDYEHMLNHYNQHLNEDQSRNARGSDNVSFRSQGFNPEGLPNIKTSSQPPQINVYQSVHQHFNQPNITNYNQNAHFTGDQDKDSLIGLRQNSQLNVLNQVSLSQDLKQTENRRHNTKSHGGGITNADTKGRKLQNQGQKGFNNQRISQADASLQDIKEAAQREDMSQSPKSVTPQVVELEGSAVEEYLGREESIDKAINQNTQQLNKNLQQNRGQFPYASIQNRATGLNNVRRAYRQTKKYYGGSNPYGNLGRYRLDRDQSARRMIKMYQPQLDNFQKEDMYDHLLLAKSQINQLNEEIKKTKTRNQILLEQLKQKDDFINEMFKQMNSKHSHRDPDDFTTSSAENLHKSSARNIQNVDNGKLGVLKLKKQISDLKEIIQMKQIESDDLVKGFKKSRAIQLQNELQIYQRENQKLKDVNVQIMDIAKRNGLEPEILKEQKARDFYAIHVNQQQKTYFRKKASKDNLVLQQLVYQNANMTDQLSQEQQKIGNQQNYLYRLKQDRTMLIEIDKQKNAKIEDLQEQIIYLKNQNSLSKTGSKAKLAKSVNRSPQRQMQGPAKDATTVEDTQTNYIEATVENDHGPKQSQTTPNGKVDDLLKQVKRLNQEKEQLTKQLIQEKNLKNDLLEKQKQGKKDLKQATPKATSQTRFNTNKNSTADNQGAEKVKKEKLELQQKFDQQKKEFNNLQKKVQQLESLSKNHSKNNTRNDQAASNKSQNNKADDQESQKKILKLTRDLESLRQKEDKSSKLVEDQKKSLGLNSKMIQTLELKVQELEKKMKERANVTARTSSDINPKQQITVRDTNTERTSQNINDYYENQTISDQKSGRNQKQIGTKSSGQRRQTDKSSKTNKSSIKSGSTMRNLANINQSQVTTQAMKDERALIEQHLQNATISEIDERSDMEFSQMKSHIQGISNSEISALNQQSDQQKKKKNSIAKNDTIKEDINEDFEQSNNFLNAGIELSGRIDRSTSHAVHQSKNHLESNTQRQANQLLEQIDQVPTESRLDDESSVEARLSTKLAQQNGLMVPYMKLEDAPIQKGFERLGRLLQIKRISLDQIENEIMQGKYRANQSIQIIDLAEIFEKKLRMMRDDAICFARFIVEEKDEEMPHITTVELDLNKKVNSLYVPIRLMTNFKKNPTIYTDAQEKNMLQKFTKVFGAKQSKFIKSMQNQSEAIVSKELFTKEIQKQVKDQLTEEDIDCAFILLSRGIKGSPPWNQDKLNKISEAEMAEKTKGFDSETLGLLFTNGMKSQLEHISDDEENYSEDNYSEEMPEETPVQSGNNSINESFQEEIIEESPRKIDKQDSLLSDNIPDTNRSKEVDSYEEDNDFVEEEIDDELPPQGSSILKGTSVPLAKEKDAPVKTFDNTMQQVNKDLLENSKKLKPFSEDRSDGGFSNQVSVSGQVKDIKSPSPVRYAQQLSPKEVENNVVIEEHKEEIDITAKAQQPQVEQLSSPSPNAAQVKDHKEKLVSKSKNFRQLDQETSVAQSSPPQSSQMSPLKSVRNTLEVDQSQKSRMEEKKQLNTDQRPSQPPINEVPEENKNSKSQILEVPKEEKQAPPIAQESVPEENKQVPAEQSSGLVVQEDSKKDETTDRSINVDANTVQKSRNDTQNKTHEESKKSATTPKIKINLDKISGALQQELKQKMGAENLEFIQVAQPAEEYEYYDEEDPEETQQQQIEQPSVSPAAPPKVEQPKKEEMKQEEQKELAPPAVEEQKEEQKTEKQHAPPPVQKPQKRKAVGIDRTFSEDEIEECKQRILKIATKNGSPKIELMTHITVDVIQQLAKIIYLYYPQLVDSCRDIFRDIIYSHRYPEFTPQEEFLDNGKAPETEIIKVQDLVFKIDELINPEKLTQDKQFAVKSVFETKALSVGVNTFLLYRDVHSVLKTLGIRDYKVPKGQQNQAHLDYDSLDLKSVRLINRMIHFLGSSQISFSDFMKDLIQIQVIKTKQSDQQVEIFIAKKFFKLLHQSEVIKNPSVHANLCYFLCIDKKYKSYLMLKKLKRCIIDFNNSDYFQSIGLKKQKLEVVTQNQQQDGDYEYYDEEDDLDHQPSVQTQIIKQVQNQQQPPMQQVPQIQQQYTQQQVPQIKPEQQQFKQAQALKTNQLPTQTVTNASVTPQVATNQQQAQQNAEEYGDEYYDEEDDTPQAQAPPNQNSNVQASSQNVQNPPNINPNSEIYNHKKIQESFANGGSIPMTQQMQPSQQQPVVSSGQPSSQAMAAQYQQQQANQQVQQAPPQQQNDDEYGDEYYDEEDDGQQR